MRCPIKGHDHEVVHLKQITQDHSGSKADIYECPNGSYRWFLLKGNEWAHAVKMRRPRWGWKNDY